MATCRHLLAVSLLEDVLLNCVVARGDTSPQQEVDRPGLHRIIHLQILGCLLEAEVAFEHWVVRFTRRALALTFLRILLWTPHLRVSSGILNRQVVTLA